MARAAALTPWEGGGGHAGLPPPNSTSILPVPVFRRAVFPSLLASGGRCRAGPC